jgi:hypothetical protein
MKVKPILTVVLVLFVCASLAYLAVNSLLQKTNSPEQDEPIVSQVTTTPPLEESPAEAEHTVVAYYFHGVKRCQTCLRIEQFAHEALEAGFPEEMESGVLEWYAVNVEEPPNQHFIADYELTTRSLVLVDVEGGAQTRWKNLSRVWELVGDRETFVRYVLEETQAYLEGAP